MGFYDDMLESAEHLDNQEGAQDLAFLDQMMKAYRNTTVNPKGLDLGDFTVAKVIIPAMNLPFPDGVTVPEKEATKLYYLKRNGKECFFNVKATKKQVVSSLISIFIELP